MQSLNYFFFFISILFMLFPLRIDIKYLTFLLLKLDKQFIIFFLDDRYEKNYEINIICKDQILLLKIKQSMNSIKSFISFSIIFYNLVIKQ